MAGDIFGTRLLVIDDEQAIGRLYARIAESEGYEVLVTADPRTFIRASRSWGPSVIILDLQMPTIDGIQLLRGLAADKCAAHVVLASGVDGKVMESAVQLGRGRGLDMSGTLQKPIRAETLRKLLAGFKPVRKATLANDLAEAITSGQLYLEYQPKLDCRLGYFTGVEALVRWRHPSRGIIRPDQFIALAEETELIHSLTDWVVATAAKQAAVWRREGFDLEVAVNISAKDIEDLDLPERLYQLCRDAGTSPASISLELTETGAMREAVQMMDVLTRLRLMGFSLSIDDFGTGYSSLVQLQRMPFSEIKIDRSFVMEMTTNAGCAVIVETIINLARNLGLKSVAEGVEQEAALKALRQLGCDLAQGFCLSRPIAADAVSRLVLEHTKEILKPVA